MSNELALARSSLLHLQERCRAASQKTAGPFLAMLQFCKAIKVDGKRLLEIATGQPWRLEDRVNLGMYWPQGGGRIDDPNLGFLWREIFAVRQPFFEPSPGHDHFEGIGLMRELNRTIAPVLASLPTTVLNTYDGMIRAGWDAILFDLAWEHPKGSSLRATKSRPGEIEITEESRHLWTDPKNPPIFVSVLQPSFFDASAAAVDLIVARLDALISSSSASNARNWQSPTATESPSDCPLHALIESLETVESYLWKWQQTSDSKAYEATINAWNAFTETICNRTGGFDHSDSVLHAFIGPCVGWLARQIGNTPQRTDLVKRGCGLLVHCVSCTLFDPVANPSTYGNPEEDRAGIASRWNAQGDMLNGEFKTILNGLKLLSAELGYPYPSRASLPWLRQPKKCLTIPNVRQVVVSTVGHNEQLQIPEVAELSTKSRHNVGTNSSIPSLSDFPHDFLHKVASSAPSQVIVHPALKPTHRDHLSIFETPERISELKLPLYDAVPISEGQLPIALVQFSDTEEMFIGITFTAGPLHKSRMGFWSVHRQVLRKLSYGRLFVHQFSNYIQRDVFWNAMPGLEERLKTYFPITDADFLKQFRIRVGDAALRIPPQSDGVDWLIPPEALIMPGEYGRENECFSLNLKHGPCYFIADAELPNWFRENAENSPIPDWVYERNGVPDLSKPPSAPFESKQGYPGDSRSAESIEVRPGAVGQMTQSMLAVPSASEPPLEPDPTPDRNAKPRRRKQPSPKAVATYRYIFVTGSTQTAAIEPLSKSLPHPNLNQGQISRWYNEVLDFLEAGGVLPPIGHTRGENHRATDPDILNEHSRSDGRVKRQKNKREEDGYA